MFHLFHGKCKEYGGSHYLENDLFGIEVVYGGHRKKGTFFLYPQVDQNTQTIKYYAFDHIAQKVHFEQLTKIQGIGGKSAYHLALLPTEELYTAIDAMDLQYFQKLPGIGPKTAKRIVIELKHTITSADLGKLDIDEQLYKDIISSLKSLGYEANRVKKILPDCPVKLDKNKLPDIMKRLIDHL